MRIRTAIILAFLALALSAPFRILQQDQPNNQQAGNSMLGMFSSFLNSAPTNKFQLTRDNSLPEKEGQEIMQDLGSDIDIGKMDNLMNILPYAALLPKRKPIPKKRAQNAIGGLSQAMQGLNMLMNSRKKQNEQQKQQVDWQNPDFADAGNMMAFSQIFGDRGAGRKKSDEVSQQQVQSLLVQQMPFLRGGNILEMNTSPFKKGVYLNIEYSDAQDDIYTIKAKYRPGKNKLEVISLSQSENPFRQSSDSEGQQQKEVRQEPEQPEQNQNMDIIKAVIEQLNQKVQAGKAKSKEKSDLKQQGEQKKDREGPQVFKIVSQNNGVLNFAGKADALVGDAAKGAANQPKLELVEHNDSHQGTDGFTWFDTTEQLQEDMEEQIWEEQEEERLRQEGQQKQ